MNVVRPRRSWRGALSAACWLVVAVVLVRMASGGGTVDGLNYVVDRAPAWALVGGAVLLVSAVGLVLAFALGASRARTASAVAAIIAIAFAVMAGLSGHESSWILGAAAAVALVVAVRDGW